MQILNKGIITMLCSCASQSDRHICFSHTPAQSTLSPAWVGTEEKNKQLYIIWNSLVDSFFLKTSYFYRHDIYLRDIYILIIKKKKRLVVIHCRYLRERETDCWHWGIPWMDFALGINLWGTIQRNNRSCLEVCLCRHSRHSSRAALLDST